MQQSEMDSSLSKGWWGREEMRKVEAGKTWSKSEVKFREGRDRVSTGLICQ